MISNPQTAPAQSTSTMRVRLRRAIPIAILYYGAYLVLVLSLQFASGTYGSEFGHDPDEPAHVVSSLMIHDYVAHGIPQNPIRYAEAYYLHYPKVAIGMWPPVFHTLAAAWLLIFPVSHGSLMLFMAAHSALAACFIALFTRRWYGSLFGSVAGALFLMFYVVQYGTSMFMLDVMVTLLDFSAALLLVRFFKSGKTRDAIYFGVLTTIAVLTKGNAIAIVLMPAVMILLLRSWAILKRPGLYVSAVIVLVFGLPWQIVSMRMLRNSVPIANVDAARIYHMSTGYLWFILESGGWVIVALAVFGAAIHLLQIFKAPRDVRSVEMAGIAALAVAVFAFHIIVPLPGPDSRYITPLFASVAIFFVSGVAVLAARIPMLPRRVSELSVVAILLALYLATAFRVPSRPPLGYDRAAESLTWPGIRNDGVVLISADGLGEGAMVAGVALRDNRPGRFVLRGSKVVNEGRWSVRVHESLLKSTDEVQKYLVSIPVDAVVIDRTAPLWPEDTVMLLDTMKQNAQSWHLEADLPAKGSQRNIVIYRYTGSKDPSGKKDIQLRMRFTLGRDLKL